MTDSYPFSAADSSLGYLYQVRVGLLWALRRLKGSGEFLISIETLDDVTFEASGSPEKLLQSKHHKSRTAALTDSSEDLWKTLRVWLDAASNNKLVPGTALHLLTTGTAPAGSIASRLGIENREVEKALKELDVVARSSQSKTNAPAYSAFLKLPEPQRLALVKSIVVIDGAPIITDLDDKLREEIFWAVQRKHHESFLERLEGWWLRRVIKQLVAIDSGDRILSNELEAQMSDLREQFKQDSLPIDDDLLSFTLDDATRTAHSNSVFVRQLELIAASKQRIAAAVRDYYRAFEQRSRWLRNDLLLVGDVSTYEHRLVEEWELVFEAAKDDIGDSAAEEAKKKAAQDVLKWAERVLIPIRPNVTEPFVTRGSLHMLADETRLGWHPDFRDRLAGILGAVDSGS